MSAVYDHLRGKIDGHLGEATYIYTTSNLNLGQAASFIFIFIFDVLASLYEYVTVFMTYTFIS